MEKARTELLIPAQCYDLAATLSSGQAFRWRHVEGSWEGVIGNHWVSLKNVPDAILAQTAVPVADWRWLVDYLQSDVEIESIISRDRKSVV